ncbi:MAG: HupE/UreJ family protein [Alteromonadaceae bacterium]|nr:HupE/UreJ family protein [Alteromonadaceae bacterium]
MLKLAKALASSKQLLQQNTIVNFDQLRSAVQLVEGPTVADIRQLFNNPVGNAGYSVKYVGYGASLANTNEVRVKLPEIMADSVLLFAKPQQIFIARGQQSSALSLKSSGKNVSPTILTITSFVDYVYQGIIHIIPQGLDHILFILALFLLATKLSVLLWQISAFTLAHTITLALGIYGIVNISANIVEPLIALSIAYVAIENIYFDHLKRWRIVIIFLFGLLHGIGFASVLLALGLAPTQYVTSLIGFNVGVELGQITVILLALCAVFWCRKKSWYRQRVVKPASFVIAAVGLFWFFERLY